MLNNIQNPYKENSNLYAQLDVMNIIKLSDNLSVIKSESPLSQIELRVLAPNGCISKDTVFKTVKDGFKVRHYEYLINSNQLQNSIN